MISLQTLRERLAAAVGALGTRTHPHTVRLFRRVIYGWYLLSTLTLLPAARQFWGPDSLIPLQPVRTIPLLQLLDLDTVRQYYLLFVFAQIALLIVGLTCRWPRTVALLIYIVTMNLNNRAWVILDGGDNLMQIMLIYLIIMDPSLPGAPVKRPAFDYANNALTNATFLMARLQVVAVYVVAGLAKVSGELWQNGTAIYYTLSVDDFTLPAVRSFVAHYPFFAVVATYVTLLYQLAFPWMIWNRHVRPWLMLLGSFIHLQIALVMGLFTFGFAVMASYVVFFPDEKSAAILAKMAALLPAKSRARSPQLPAAENATGSPVPAAVDASLSIKTE
jgi:hypothetical protein